MLRYEFDNDSGEYAVAKQHAESYAGSDDIENKIKGNLAEIAFQKLCLYTIEVDKWHWHNETDILRANPEFNDDDFTVFGQTIDVKARSRLDHFFRISEEDVNSEYVVYVWVPPQVTEAVLEAEDVMSLSSVHPSKHDPAVILGFSKADELSTDSTTLHHPAPQGPTLTHLPAEPIWNLPFGANLSHVLDPQLVAGGTERIGIREMHMDANEDRLIPGVVVDAANGNEIDPDTGIERGLVVECPNVPADTEFSSERGQYKGRGLYAPRDLAIGIIDFEEMTDGDKEPAKRIIGSDLYPALSGFLSADYDIIRVAASSVVKKGSLLQID